MPCPHPNNPLSAGMQTTASVTRGAHASPTINGVCSAAQLRVKAARHPPLLPIPHSHPLESRRLSNPCPWLSCCMVDLIAVRAAHCCITVFCAIVTFASPEGLEEQCFQPR